MSRRGALRRTRSAPFVRRPRPLAVVSAPALYACTKCGRADLTEAESSDKYDDLCTRHGEEREDREHDEMAREDGGHRANCDCTLCFETDAASKVRL